MHLDHLPGSFFGPSNLVDLLRHRALHQGSDRGFTFLVDGEDEEVTLSYAQLDRRARAIGAILQSMDLAGERALLLYPAGLDFVAAFFGCLYAGVVAVPGYPPRRNRNMNRIEAIANDASAKIALTTQGVLERIEPVIAETANLKQMAWLATDQTSDGRHAEWREPDVHGDTLAFLQYTSGSTGAPKGVMLTHANLMHNSAMIAYAFEHSRSGSGMFWLPLYHDMGLIGGVLQPLYVGQPNVLLSPIQFLQQPFRWLRAISKYRATISGGPNFAYDLCVDKITEEQKATLDLSCWTLAFNGAEPVRASTLDRFTKAFESCGFRREAFYPCYGLAEATLIVSGGFKNTPPTVRCVDSEALENHQVEEALADEVGSRELVGSGGNLLDQHIVIVDPHTLTECAADQIGEIWVNGPSIAQGYMNCSEETEKTFRATMRNGAGPYLRTGDLGFLLDGELFVTGRLKDLIIIRGVNYYPQDIEHTVGQCHEHLRPGACAAFALVEGGQERLVVVQEAARRRELDFEAIFSAIRKGVAAEHELSIDAIVLIKSGSIPKTSSGKIQRHANRAAYLDGSLSELARWPAAPEDATAGAGTVEIRTGPRYIATTSTPGALRDGEPVPRGRKATGRAVGPDRAGVLDATGGSDRGISRDRRADSKAPLEASPTARRTADIVYEHVRAVAQERAGNLTLETSIVELGLDSLERIEIANRIEEAFGGRFPEDVMAEMETCGQVVAAVETYLGATPRGKPERPLDFSVPTEHYQFGEFAEYRQLKQQMQQLRSMGVPNPFFKQNERVTNDTTMIDGRELINFSSFNYLGMSGDPVVSQAAKSAVNQYGTSVSASRVVSGEKPLHRELERALADFIGAQDAVCFVGGHSTNETTIGHLLGSGDLVLHDALAHNSIVQGCILSGARRRPFPHNDWRECDRLLQEYRHEYRRVLIAIEGVYSMDGDYPDLPRFIEVKQKHKALLMVDEAHSIGTMGLHGRGISEHFGIDSRDVDIWMGTLSKSFGSCGGYIAGCHELVEYLKYTAPGFVYSVGLSPANAAAALASLQLLEEEPDRVARLARNASLFLDLAKEKGLNTGLSNHTPVVPIVLGNSMHCMRLSRRLFERGVNVQPIVHPAVEENAARMRFFITTSHTPEQIRQTIEWIAEELQEIDPGYLSHRAKTSSPAPAPSLEPRDSATRMR